MKTIPGRRFAAAAALALLSALLTAATMRADEIKVRTCSACMLQSMKDHSCGGLK